MNIVFIHELIKYNELIHIIKESLNDIKKAISGTVILTPNLEELFDALTSGKLPRLWLRKSYPSTMSLGNYMHDLCYRLSFFKVVLI